MHRPPDLTWAGDFPYDTLAPAGVTPYSTMKEVVMAMAFFTRHGGAREAHRAWTDLGKVEERLLLDFFLYRHDPVVGPGDGDE